MNECPKEDIFRVYFHQWATSGDPISWYTKGPQAMMCARAGKGHATHSNPLVSSGQMKEKPMEVWQIVFLEN